jgi:hypothetical protein
MVGIVTESFILGNHPTYSGQPMTSKRKNSVTFEGLSMIAPRGSDPRH